MTSFCSRFAGLIIILLFSHENTGAQEYNSHNISLNSENKTGILFTENLGQVTDQFHQTRKDILFMGEINGMVFHIRKDGISYQLYEIKNYLTESEYPGSHSTSDYKLPGEMTIYRTDINWIGTNSDFKITRGKVRPGYNNYYLASCPDGITCVSSYESLTFENIYQGIDITWYENNDQLEYDFVLKPNTDYRQIRWEVGGATDLYVNEDGLLVMVTPLGIIMENPPLVYQGNEVVESKWSIDGNTVSFELGDYDLNQVVTIDPLLRIWGTYYGGTMDDIIMESNFDNLLNVYLTGYSNSSAYIATTGTHQNTFGGIWDGFLAKFNAQGQRVWATYYGGSQTDYLLGCSVDGGGFVYASGYTTSTTAVATASSHQSSYSGNTDGLLVKFNSSGIRVWGTYYGGTGFDRAGVCQLDKSGDIYLPGYTSSSGGIATVGSHKTTFGGVFDAFMAKFTNSGTRIWSTYYGGTSDDKGSSCITEDSSYVYLYGQTASSANISTPGAHQDSLGGGTDGLLVKFSTTGNRLWATYYGGTGDDFCYAGTMSNSTDFYVGGKSTSSNNISTAGAHQVLNAGFEDVFLVKFDSSGTRSWATYMGGSGIDIGRTLKVDPYSNIFLAGRTASSTGISTTDGFQTIFGGNADAFFAIFDPAGIRQWATYYGGSGFDDGYGFAQDSGVYVYFSGYTQSSGGIATAGSYQETYGGGIGDAFIVKLGNCLKDSSVLTTSACDSFVSPSGKHNWTVSGIYRDTLDNIQGCDSVLIIHLTIVSSPVVTSTQAGSVCDSGIAVLHATASSGTIFWYASLTDTIPLDSGTSINSPYITSPDTFYVEAYNGCTSQRTSVVVGVNHGSTSSISAVECESYSFLGTVLKSSGLYRDTLSNALGCDSIITLSLTIVAIDSTVTLNGKTLTAFHGGLAYTWIDCVSGNSIPGANAQTFTPSQSGNYAVVLRNGLCFDTSACISVLTGIHETNSSLMFSVYPNPSGDVFHISFETEHKKITVMLSNEIGQIILRENYHETEFIEINLSAFASGSYNLTIITESRTGNLRLIKL